MWLHRILSIPRLASASLRALNQRHLEAGKGWALGFICAAQDVWAARRDVLFFLKTGDLATAHALRCRFGLVHGATNAAVLQEAMFQNTQSPSDPPPNTIIIPVFRALEATVELLDSLKISLDANQSILVCDDGSKDPKLSDQLKAFIGQFPKARLIENHENLGFLGTVNLALAQIPQDHHAIILNSDTLPPADWVPRLLAPFLADPQIATVTPMSNAAEILSIPAPGQGGSLSAEQVLRIDETARRLKAKPVDIPTGVGFCMALNRTFLSRLGGFDPAFGKGYGEEVDWCQRARAIGGRHVALPGLFVGHQGAASFGAKARTQKVKLATKNLKKRFPNFSNDVRLWEQSDPLSAQRLALAIAWIAAKSVHPVPVFFGHSMGGGAETALRREIDQALQDGAKGVVILRAGGPALWRVEAIGPRFELLGDTNDSSILHKILTPLSSRRVIYSCAVGTTAAALLPDTILKVAEGHRLEIRMHDFFAISPSWNLLGKDGTFRGVPDVTTTDPAHQLANQTNGPGCTCRQWRQSWQRVMEAADEVTVFAETGRALVETAYPSVVGKTKLRPHALKNLPSHCHHSGQALGVLGGINLAKGGAVLERLAKITNRRIVVIGELERSFYLGDPHLVHGRYAQDKISTLAKQYGIGAWFIPSICPETFSFATHEALATGLPVACFDLGAQGEAAFQAANGHVLLASPDDIEALAIELDSLWPAYSAAATASSGAA